MKAKILLLIGTALLFFAVTTMAQVPSYVPSNGLVGWWPFSGNASDLSGNGNNGTVTGATLTTDRNGNVNAAYSFNGSSNYIQASLTTALNTSSINGITLSGWTNSISYTISSPQVITGLFDASGSAYAIMWGANGSNGFLLGECGASGVAPSMIIYQLTSPLINSWYHVVMTCDLASNISKLYINGIFQSQSTNVLIHPTLNKIIIGKWTSNWFQNGKLDDIGIWNRALTQTEVTTLYQGCSLAITTSPVNQNVNIGSNAQFIVAASDTSAIYHWQTDLGLGFQNISNAGQYSGATNDTLIVTNTTVTNNGQVFRCIVSSGACSDTSTLATLTACPTITSQPTNQTVNTGNSALFITTYSDQSATYHWQTDLGLGFQNISNAGQYSGATNDSLIVSNTTVTNNGQLFRCIAYSGNCSDTSNVITLSVTTLGINEAAVNNSFKVYPNPANSQINVQINANLIGSIFTITDQIGKTVLSGKLTNENSTIELGDLSGGVYLFSIGNNAKQTFKVIKK